MPQSVITPELYSFAGQQMRTGVAPVEIQKSLTQQGLNPEAAAIVINNLMQANSVRRR
jgi:hypothetical protein